MHETTILIHQLIGPIFLLLGISMLFNRRFYVSLFRSIKENSLYAVLGLIINILVGFSIVINHNLWGTFPEILASLFGWAALLKGLGIAIAPKSFMSKAASVASPVFLLYGSLVVIVIGVYMSWVGYFS